MNKPLIKFPFSALQLKLADRYKKYIECKWWQFSKKANLWAEAKELEKAIEEKRKQTDESTNHSIY